MSNYLRMYREGPTSPQKMEQIVDKLITARQWMREHMSQQCLTSLTLTTSECNQYWIKTNVSWQKWWRTNSDNEREQTRRGNEHAVDRDYSLGVECGQDLEEI